MIYPATHNWNDWRDVKEGESPDAYYARTGLAGYGRTNEELRKLDYDRQPAELKKHFETYMATGPFDPNSLSDDDLYYICRHVSEMTFDPRELMHGLYFSPDVGRVGGQKFGDGSAHYDVVANESKVRADVVQALREMASGEPKFWMLQAFPFLDGVKKDEYLTAWKAGWKRLHPGVEP